MFHFIINDKAVKLWNVAVLKGEINYCQVSSSYTPPTKHGILKLMNEKKIRVTEKVAVNLPSKSGSIAITHDGWSSCTIDSYSTVTAYFITSAWELRSVVLHTHQVQGSHTSEKIADGLKETVSTWNLPNPTCVTDNAANEKNYRNFWMGTLRLLWTSH